VHVRQGNPRFPEPLELRADLPSELPPRRGLELIGKAYSDRTRGKAPVGSDAMRYFAGRQHRTAIDDDQMKTDGEARMGAGQFDGLVARFPSHHEARGGQNTALVSLDDRAVDAAREPEVIPRDDQAPQTRSSLLERNRKNSAPSRSRRLNISALDAISQVISAILRGRK